MNRRVCLTTCVIGFMLVIVLILIPEQRALSSDNSLLPITLTNHTHIVNLTSDHVTLARISTRANDEEKAVFHLVWAKDTTGWFPVWKLMIVSEFDLLPSDKAVPGTDPYSSYQVIVLDEVFPSPDHTYETVLSYSPKLGALAINVKDLEDDKMIYSGGMEVASYAGPLHAAEGTTSQGYFPVGITWTPGIRGESMAFLSLDRFANRSEDVMIRIVSPTAVDGEFRIYLDHHDEERYLHAIKPARGENYIPLSISDFPIGHASLRLDYVENGDTLYTTSSPITVGRVDVVIPDQLQPRHEDRVVDAQIHFKSAEPIEEDVEAVVTASLYELIWNDQSKDFDEVLYKTTMLYDDQIDLATASASIPLEIDMPEKRSNWKTVITVDITPPISLSNDRTHEGLFSTHAAADISQGDPYTIVVFPDTQFMSDRYPWIYTRMTDWVAAHAADLNIAAALHVGDITDRNTRSEWDNAYASMSLLHGVVPYALTIGNHDMIDPRTGSIAERGHTLINHYFSVEEARRYSSLAGTMKEGQLENHYYLWSIGNDDYVIIALEFLPPDEAIEWANTVAKNYPDHRMILLTHSYTNRQGRHSGMDVGGRFAISENPETTINTGVDMWSKLVSKHPHSFMTVSGHLSTPLSIPHHARWTPTGQTVYELLINYQSQPMGGNGWLGLMTFYPDDIIDVRLFSPFLDEYADAVDDHGFGSHLKINLMRRTIQQQTSGE